MRRPNSASVFVGCSMGFFLSLPLQAQEDPRPLPIEGTHDHLGVASCASSTCHGAQSPFPDSRVRQDEFALWQSFDPHAQAYSVLLNSQSKSIARKLGIGPAHEADVCLDCHADNVPIAARGEKFRIEDGVGCEACHGGSSEYISSHTASGATHSENVANGLYPLAEPASRSRLCLSCHLGNPDQMITHEIMGAGHPRLSFELDTFTWLYPHYEVDEDYVERKGEIDGVRDWGVGQGVAASTQLETLLDEQAGWNGIFPELVLFDCHACHRSMFETRWEPRAQTGLGPGVVRFNDANLIMFRHVLSGIDQRLADRIAEQTKRLHQSTLRGRGETELAAQQLLESLELAVPQIASQRFDSSDLRPIFLSLLRDGAKGQYRDYAAAEQAAMAVQTVIEAYAATGALDKTEETRLRERSDALFGATESEPAYRQADFINALERLESAAP